MTLSRSGLAACAVCTLVLAACGLQLATPSGEAKLGAEQAAEVEKAIGLVDAPALEQYVGEIGARIARVAGSRDGVAYQFHVVEMVEPNAFALPGGHIYVSRGLLVLLNEEDELANALAHEVGHVAARHHLEHTLREVPFVPVRIATGVAISAVQLATLPLGVLGAPLQIGTAAVGMIGEVPAALYLASFSRSQETEADELGQRFASEAGWDAHGMATLMDSLSRYERLQGSDPDRMSYFSTHPASPERSEAALARAAQLVRTPAAPIAAGRAEFYEKLVGLLVGEPASNGVVSGDEFLHSELDLRLAFPANWKIVNGVNNVTASPPDDEEGEEVFSSLSLAAEGGDPEAVARSVLAKTSLRVDGGVTQIDINGLPAARAQGRDGSGRSAYRVDVVWIAHVDHVFQIVGAAPAAKWDRYAPALEGVAQQFRPLRQADRQRIVEARLRVVKGRGSEKPAALLSRFESAWDVPMFAAANALPEESGLAAHQPVKLAVYEPYPRDR